MTLPPLTTEQLIAEFAGLCARPGLVRLRFLCPSCDSQRSMTASEGTPHIEVRCPCGWSLGTPWVRLRVVREPLVWEGED